LLHQSQETAEGIERELSDIYLSRLLILREIAERLGKDPVAARIGRRQRVTVSLCIIALALVDRIAGVIEDRQPSVSESLFDRSGHVVAQFLRSLQRSLDPH
jgi:hypothetical protein